MEMQWFSVCVRKPNLRHWVPSGGGSGVDTWVHSQARSGRWAGKSNDLLLFNLLRGRT